MYFADEFMVVSIPGMLVHLLDVDPSHCGPSCHIVLSPETNNNHTLAIRRLPDQTVYANAETLETLDFKINSDKIRKAYNLDRSCLLNNLSVLHYFLAHEDYIEAISDVNKNKLPLISYNVFHLISLNNLSPLKIILFKLLP